MELNFRELNNMELDGLLPLKTMRVNHSEAGLQLQLLKLFD